MFVQQIVSKLKWGCHYVGGNRQWHQTIIRRMRLEMHMVIDVLARSRRETPTRYPLSVVDGVIRHATVQGEKGHRQEKAADNSGRVKHISA